MTQKNPFEIRAEMLQMAKDYMDQQYKMNIQLATDMYDQGQKNMIELQDAYKSVDEALMHGGYALGKKVIVEKIAAEDIELDPTILKNVDGILIPGGFGSRGMEGKIMAAQYAREEKTSALDRCKAPHIIHYHH